MSGPAVSVLLRHPLPDNEQYTLQQWLRSISHVAPLTTRSTSTDFYLTNGEAIGLPFAEHPEAGPFGLDIEACAAAEIYAHQNDEELWLERAEEEEQFLRYLGYVPQQEIVLWAYCGHPHINHVILGHLALHLVERYDDLIDMDGAITPPLPPDPHRSLSDYPWTTLDEIRAYVHQLPGQVYEMEYTTGPEDRWVHHVVDSAFFRAWLQHPHFHMIK